MYLACQAYPWMVVCRRRGTTLMGALDGVLAAVSDAGCDGWEMFLDVADDVVRQAEACAHCGLEIRTAYANAPLHREAEADQAIDGMLERADRVYESGLRYLVVNPEPVDWQNWHAKTDAELDCQIRAMNRLGRQLAERGVTLAYHTHGAEMHDGARELHHTLIHTNPDWVSFCLDFHWIYRGCGDSQAAVHDIIHLYGDRVSTLHLRQSQDGLWTEVFGEGDLDYSPLMKTLRQRGFDGPVVLEQIVEAEGEMRIEPEEALRQSVANARRLCS